MVYIKFGGKKYHATKSGVPRVEKMAKRKVSKKRSKKSNEPAVRHLRFLLGNDVTAGVPTQHYLDCAQVLSVVNRRMYRQGMSYTIKKITVTSRDTNNGLVTVSAAPTSWMVAAAWKKSFSLWNQMRKGHGGAPGSGLPKGVTAATWADYKVWLTDTHRTTGSITPVDLANNQAVQTNAEWQHARFVAPEDAAASDEYEVHLLGADNGASGARVSAGIVQGYEESRRTVEQDNTGSEINTDAWMINLFDDGDTLDEIVQDLKEDGDYPPYQFNMYSGAALNMPEPIVQQLKALVPNGGILIPPSITPLSQTSSITLGEVVAPCGLVQITTNSDVALDTFDVLIEFAPGSYKGVKALPM